MLPLLWMAMGVGRNNKISCVFLDITNGVAAVRRAVSYARQTGIKFLTLYAFSSENWNRPEQEVSALMTLFIQALDREVKKLHKNNIRLKIIGDVSRFSENCKRRSQKQKI